MVNFGLNSASVLAQVNWGTNPASFLGIFLAVAGAALYFLRSVRPELSRDQDIFFAAIGLLCGFILIFQGWRLDPILQFGQMLLIGSTVFFAVESIRLRGIATQQAKEKTPIVDKGRRVSDNYEYEDRYDARVEAELDPLPYDYEDERSPRRIPGSRDSRSSRDDYYYEDEPRRRSERRSGGGEKPTPTTDKTRRRSGASRTSELEENEDWGGSRKVDEWDSSTNSQRRPPRRSSNGSSRIDSREDDLAAKRTKRRRPQTDSTDRSQRDRDDVTPSEYVDYKPIERSDEDPESRDELS